MRNQYIRIGLICILVFIFSALRAAVDLRITMVSHTQIPAGTSTLIVDIEARASYAYNIYKFQGAFYIGDGLRDLSPTITYPDTTTHFFTNSEYNFYDGTSSGIIRFKWKLRPAATETQMTANVWTQILRYTIQYPTTEGASSSFSWYDGDEDFLWTVEVFSGFPIPVTGGRVSIPNDLIDMSLPVQMGQMTAAYEYEDGVILDWTTHSEYKCSGFYVLRSNTSNGPFKRISDELIPAHGTTNVYNDYTFQDTDLQFDTEYFYKLHEISEDYGDTTKVYYGPMSVKTGKAPEGFVLYPNYPNPFNPETRIKYEIIDESRITLRIYDVLGKEIITLVDEKKPTGIYRTSWDGSNQTGVQVPSGIYILKLVSDERTTIQKMTKVH